MPETLKLTLEITQPKFRVGDFLELTRLDRLSDFYAIVRIDDLYFAGAWHVTGDTARIEYGQNAAYYSTTVQEGSRTSAGPPLRPGTCLSFDFWEADAYATKVAYTKQVWSPDTQANLDRRLSEWAATYIPENREFRAIALD